MLLCERLTFAFFQDLVLLISHESKGDSVLRTWCRWGVQVHLLTVLAVARLVAASHPQHVHAVHLQPVDHGAAPANVIQALPAPPGGGQTSPDPAPGSPSWDHASSAILNGEAPGWGGVRGQSPGQEELVVGQGPLSVDDWSQGSCDNKPSQMKKLLLLHLLSKNLEILVLILTTWMPNSCYANISAACAGWLDLKEI